MIFLSSGAEKYIVFIFYIDETTKCGSIFINSPFFSHNTIIAYLTFGVRVAKFSFKNFCGFCRVNIQSFKENKGFPGALDACRNILNIN